MLKSTLEQKRGAIVALGREISRWAAGLALAMLLASGPAGAQVPQNLSFSGRLVDGAGAPLPTQLGFVTLDLFVLDCPTQQSCNGLFGERHNTVSLDAQGNFTVLLGAGDELIQGSFDAALFSGPDRYVEVVVVDNPTPGLHYLSPRVPLSSTPYALVAQQASKIVREPTASRYEDCGDGTVADHKTGLQWEKKTGTLTSQVVCYSAPCPDPHDVNNAYKWSVTSPWESPDGKLFTDFLARLNGTYDPSAALGCFAEHCDWRLPEISELQAILNGPGAAPGQSSTCPPGGNPCLDPDFAAIDGPMSPYPHWSSTRTASDPGIIWFAYPYIGSIGSGSTINDFAARAVRAGSCD